MIKYFENKTAQTKSHFLNKIKFRTKKLKILIFEFELKRAKRKVRNESRDSNVVLFCFAFKRALFSDLREAKWVLKWSLGTSMDCDRLVECKHGEAYSPLLKQTLFACKKRKLTVCIT